MLLNILIWTQPENQLGPESLMLDDNFFFQNKNKRSSVKPMKTVYASLCTSFNFRLAAIKHIYL